MLKQSHNQKRKYLSKNIFHMLDKKKIIKQQTLRIKQKTYNYQENIIHTTMSKKKLQLFITCQLWQEKKKL